jgi:hypothetical protein
MDGMEVTKVRQIYKHSPGPWQFIGEETVGTNMGGILDANGYAVCDFGDAQQYYPVNGNPPNEYDAKLMEASPELYDWTISLVSALATVSTVMRSKLPLDPTEVADWCEEQATGALKLLERISKGKETNASIKNVVDAIIGKSDAASK